MPLRSMLGLLLFVSAGSGEPPRTLQSAFADDFDVGVAIGRQWLADPGATKARQLASTQFNTATPENQLKWERVHPRPGLFDFTHADRFLAFCEGHGLSVVGHTLCWHSQAPDWVFHDESGKPLEREELLARMRTHIYTVAGHCRGRLKGWDVVNEALNDDGTLRDSPWRRGIGDDYLEHAFRFAAEADPGAELYYNDYSLHMPAKRAGVLRLVKRLKAAGCRVDGVGMQGHWSLGWPDEREIEASIEAYSAAVDKVMISELDVNILPWPGDDHSAEVSRILEQRPELDPYTQGLPDRVQEELAKRYVRLFKIFLRHRDAIDRVTFWGIDDGRSWHNGWPIPGRTAHSLLFDRSQQPKPAYHAVLATKP